MSNVVLIVGLLLNLVILPLAAKRIWFLYSLISSGQPAPDRIEGVTKRLGNALKSQLVEVLGQKKLLKWTVPGIAHAFVMYAFLILASVYLEAYGVLLSRDASWHFLIFNAWGPLGFAQDLIGVLCLIGLATFTVIRIKNAPEKLGRKSRFKGSHLGGAWLTLFMIFNVIWTMFLFRGASSALGNLGFGKWAFASYGIGKLLGGPTESHAIEVLEGIGLILHIGVMLAFLLLVLHSKHLHIFIAPLNVMFKRPDGPVALGPVKPLTAAGKPVTLDDIEDMDEDTTLGIGSIEDFSWKGMLDFASCTECGRCQSQCPAWNTDKPLSPKMLIMNLRDHAFTAAPYFLQDDEAKRASLPAAVIAEAERPLVGESEGEDKWHPTGGAVIDDDVLWSCTQCGACVNQCPVDIEHVDHIIDMRRYQVLVESNFPAELNGLFRGLEGKGNPWNMNPNARMEWAQGLPFDVKVVGEDIESLDDVEWLFWVGCAGAYEDRAKKTTRAVAELLDLAGVSFGVLGNGETCTGDSARRAGNEFVFQGLAQQNIATLTETKAKKVVSTCPHCMNTLKNEYRQLGLELEVIHHTQLLNRLVREKKLVPVGPQEKTDTRSITYHDPCFLGRHNQVYEPPRELLQILPGAELTEMPRHGERSFCCGAGGARMWMEETIGERINVNRTKEAVATGADQIAVGCPFCRVMLADGLVEEQAAGNASEDVEVLDVAQMLLASVKGESPKARAPKPAPSLSGDAPAAPVAPAAEPPAPASGGSLFDAAPAPSSVEPAETKPAGGSLFDTPAPAEPVETKPAGGSLFDTPAPAPAEPKADVSGGGSLFDVAPTAPAEPKADMSGGGSLFDVAPTPQAEVSAPTEKPAEPQADLGSGGSLFDVAPAAAAEPAPVEPVETKPTEAPKPAADLGSGGSLFDIPATPPTPAVEPVETETETEAEAEAESTEPEAAEKPKPSGETHQPKTDTTIPEGGSLFDI